MSETISQQPEPATEAPYELQPEESSAPEGELKFLSYEAVRAYLREKFKNGLKETARDVFAAIPENYLQELFNEAYQQNNEQTPRTVTINIDGVIIHIRKRAFYELGLDANYCKWGKEAFKNQIKTFEQACDCIIDPSFRKNNRGWYVVQDWWEEITKRAFKENPNAPLVEMNFIHKGKKIYTPYCHILSNGFQPDLIWFNSLIRKLRNEYLSQSFNNVLQYMQEAGTFTWDEIPQKWHEEFCKRAVSKNPYASIEELCLDINGKKIEVPVSYYYVKGKTKSLIKIIRNARTGYMDTLEKAVRFIGHEKFGRLGGWALIPEKWHELIIVQAISSSPRKKPGMSYPRIEIFGVNISLERLSRLYKKTGRFEKYKEYYRKGLALHRKKTQKEKQSYQSPSTLKEIAPDIRASLVELSGYVKLTQKLKPTRRKQCEDLEGPCPFVSCRHHLALSIRANGGIDLSFPELETEDEFDVTQMPETCALNVAERKGPLNLNEVGELLNVSGEYVRQIENNARKKAKRRSKSRIPEIIAELR